MHGPTRVEALQERRRGNVAAGLVALFGAAVLALTLTGFMVLYRDLERANEARDQLATQVEELGATPVAGPPGSRGQPGPAVTGPPGADGRDGADGADGQPGESGPTGKPGAAGTDGVDGQDGEPGAAGGDGADGASGQAGAPGPAGPAGPRGETGPQGPAGRDGSDGKDGRDGQACPAGFELRPWALDDDVLVCQRVSGGDGSSPDPDPAGSSPSVGMLAPERRRLL